MMDRRIQNRRSIPVIPVLLLSLILSLVLTGCSTGRTAAESVSGEKTYVYCMDTKGEKLYAMEYDAVHSSNAEVIDEYLTEMKNCGRIDGYASVLPEGLNLRSFTVVDGLLTLDFNAVYNNMDDVQEAITRSALTLTMLQLPNVYRVLITVDGSTITNSLKREIQPMTRESVLLTWRVIDGK